MLNNLEAYKLALSQHDWFFVFSDDNNAYKAGERSLASLKSQQKTLDPDYAIWNSIAPEACRVKV